MAVSTQIQEVDVTVSTKGTQTDQSCVSFCESCHLSTGLIKNLVQMILTEQRKHKVKETHVSHVKSKMEFKVFEVSQWGAMSRWAEAIQRDFKTAASISYSVQQQYFQLKQDKHAMELEQEKIISLLKNDLELCRKQLEAEKAKCAYLALQVEDLNYSLRRQTERENLLLNDLKKFDQQLRKVRTTSHQLQNECVQLKKTQNSMAIFVKSVLYMESISISNTKNNCIDVIKKMEKTMKKTTKSELQKKKEMLEEKKNEIYELKCQLLRCEGDVNKLQEEITYLNTVLQKKEIEIEQTRDLETKVKHLEELLEESKAHDQLIHRKGGGSTDSEMILSGNPLTDMENQRKENKIKIKTLLQENKNLKVTIFKLKGIISCKNTPTSTQTNF